MKKDLISIDDLGLEQILDYLDLAARVEALPNAEKAGLLPGKILEGFGAVQSGSA